MSCRICLKPIYADTEDWSNPLCYEHYHANKYFVPKEKLLAQIETLTRLVEEMEKALEFYGDIDNWECKTGCNIDFDTINECDIEKMVEPKASTHPEIGGKRARQALSSYQQYKEQPTK